MHRTRNCCHLHVSIAQFNARFVLNTTSCHKPELILHFKWFTSPILSIVTELRAGQPGFDYP
jgi:hypothetical protein